jgi:alpha-ketoglutarate-dependent taurine dioxygenase
MRPRVELHIELESNANLARLLRDEASRIRILLATYRAVLLRGSPVASPVELESVLPAILGPLMDYIDRGTTRSTVHGRVFTATDKPGQHSIYLHCESSFAAHWPHYIAFYCAKSAEVGGETPLADVHYVFHRLPRDVREEFVAKGVVYVRTYPDGPEPLWHNAYQVSDRAAAERYFRTADVDYQWIGDNGLQTRQLRPAAVMHPESGEEVWFNQAEAFNTTSLGAHARAERICRPYAATSQSYFGDGSAIPPDFVQAIVKAYAEETIQFSWCDGDLLLLDNLRVAHGRRPFGGNRTVWVAMGEPIGWKDVNVIKKCQIHGPFIE